MSYSKLEEKKIDIEELPTHNEGFDIYENHTGCFCTDFYCLVFFLVSLIAVLVIFIVGFKKGDPKRLISPLSIDGEFCGLDAKKSFPYLYMPNFPVDLSEGSLCVSSCPTPGKCILEDGTITDASNSSCAIQPSFPYDDSVSVLYRCIPNVKEYLQNSKVYGASSDFFTILVNDIQQAWWIFLIALFLTIFVSFIFLCFVRCCSGCIVWTSIIACILIVLGLGIWTLAYGFHSYAKDTLKTDHNSSIAFIVFGFLLIALALLITLLAFCCLRKQIALAAGILSEASQALRDVWTVYLSPLLYLVLFAAIVVVFVVTLVYYCSGVHIDTTDGVKTISLNTTQRATVVVAFFIFLWITVFLVGCNQATIAGAISAWYFTRRKEQLPTFSAGASAYTLFLHHYGSVAVGSFLIALVYFVRAVVLYMERKLKEEGLKESKIFRCLCGCLNCCLGCIARVLEFISSHAYILMSIYGTNFFSSAGTAVKLLGSNPLRSAVLTTLSRFIVVCLELLVTGVVTVVCVVILRPAFLGIQGGVDVYYWWFLAFGCFVFALVVSIFAFHVYSFLLRVIFICFLIDEELAHKHGGSYKQFASSNLVTCMEDYTLESTNNKDVSYSDSSYHGGSSGTATPSKSALSGTKVDF